MAKKTVASLKKADAKGFAKVIKAVKSAETGAYIFEEKIVPNEDVKETLKG